VDATPGDATQAADTIVDGSGSLSITAIDAQNDYTEGLTVANDGTVTFDRTDNNAAYQLKFSGNGITIGNSGDDTITLTGADEFTTPLTTDGDLFVQAGGSDSRLGIGSDGQYLSVSSGSPAWVDLSSGDVSKVGTPANYQLGVWTGDGTIQGTNDVRYITDSFYLTSDASNYSQIYNYGRMILRRNGYNFDFDGSYNNQNWGSITHPGNIRINSGSGTMMYFDTSGNVSVGKNKTVGSTNSSRFEVNGAGNTSATSVVKFNNASDQTLFEIKGDGACYINDMLTQGAGNTITSVGNTSFVMGGYNDFHSGAYSGILGYNNEITAFGNQTIIIGGSSKSNQVRTVLVGQYNQALFSDNNFAFGYGIKMGGSDKQVGLGINLNLTSSSTYGKGVFLGYNNASGNPEFGIVKPGTSTGAGNIGIGISAASLYCAGAENSGNAILYISNYANQAVEPTANAQDSVGLWAKDWNGTGTMGLVIKSEEGTRHFLGAASVIGGDYSDAIDGVKLLVKGNTQIDGQVYAPYNTLTDGATITPDFNDSNNMVVTLAGNRTMANPSNLKDGASYTIIVKQDATGSRTLSFGTAFKWAGGTAPTLSTGANAVDILTFVSDGTNLYGSFVGDFQ